jgi:hypothetical protein
MTILSLVIRHWSFVDLDPWPAINLDLVGLPAIRRRL